MNDSELLALAAAVYNDPSIKRLGPDGGFVREVGRDPVTGCLVFVDWNTLLDDGDAFRLMVKLGIQCTKPLRSRSIGRVVRAWYPPDGNPLRAVCAHVSVHINGDRLAATRRSITLAAAEMAKLQLLTNTVGA